MQSGDEIGPYRLIQRIDQAVGPGVWKVQSLEDQSFTGLRLIDVGAGEQNFVQHLTAVYALSEPRIHPLEGFGVHEGRLGWVALSPPRGTLLTDQIAEGNIPYAEALIIAEDILEALVVAHEGSIYHGALTSDDITLGADGWVTANLGLNDLSPGAILAIPGDDLDAVKTLIRQMVSVPPPSLRALLNAGPSTAVAFLRALQTLPINEGVSAEIKPEPPVSSPPAKVRAKPRSKVSSSGVDQPVLELGARTAAQASNAGLEPIDSWGVDLDSGAVSWVDRERELIKTSSKSGGGSEASWGVSETGPNVIQPDEDSSFGVPQFTALLVLVAAGILAAVFVLKTSSTPTVAETAVNETAQEVSARGFDEQEKTTRPSVVEEDAGRPEGVVDVTFSPVAVRVYRIEDGKIVCDGRRVCRLPIDIDYRAEHTDFEPLHVSGDDLFDRRESGQWRLVLQPKPAPEPRRKRRRRQP